MSDIKVLLALQSDESIERVRDDLSALKRLKFFESRDGTDSLFKLNNSAHHILIIEENLAKRSGSQVIDWVLKKGGASLSKMGLILISDEELSDKFQDACASGRLKVISHTFGSSQMKLAFVHAFNYFSGTSRQEFKVRILSQGDVLIRQGEKADNVYLLQKGKLRAIQNSEANERLLGDITPGEFVGEMAYINQDMRSATVIADEHSELVEIPIQFADQILFQKPSWAKALMKTLSKRLKRSNLRTP